MTINRSCEEAKTERLPVLEDTLKNLLQIEKSVDGLNSLIKQIHSILDEDVRSTGEPIALDSKDSPQYNLRFDMNKISAIIITSLEEAYKSLQSLICKMRE